MPYYPEELIDEIRNKNDIVDVISGHVALKKSGRRYTGLCPFHSEKTGSFSVDQDKQLYYCFGCHAAGNVFTFVEQYENMTFPEAVKYLADRARIELPEINYTDEMKQQRDRKGKLLEVMYEAEKYFFHQLKTPEGALGLKYFKSRELDDEIIKSFGLGYSLQRSHDIVDYLRQKGYDDELIREAGLGVFYEKEGMKDKFINRVMFPIQDMNGKVIGFGGRVMGEAKPKYLNSPENLIFEKRKNLFALNRARSARKGRIILCEGYMDVISMHQAGFTEAVASLGTAFTPEQAALLKRFTDRVLLAYDSDGAGKNAALKAIDILASAGIEGRVIDLKPYKDPDEFIKALGPEKFEERLNATENGFLFKIDELRGKYTLDDAHPEQKTAFERETARLLCSFEDELERENYIRAVSARYGIDESILKRAVISQASAGVNVSQPKISVDENKDRKKRAEDAQYNNERLFIAWIVAKPGLYEQIKDDIKPEEFTDPVCEKTARLVFEGIENGKLDPAAIIDRFEEDERSKAAACLQDDPYLFRDGGSDIDGMDNDQAAVFKNTLLKIKRAGAEKKEGAAGSIDELIKNKRLMQELEKKRYIL
ncbi:MAG: DNA primase [Lachnospiraceae bacterium]|nr:DNA primase [Lachnospiraceae bacterium]